MRRPVMLLAAVTAVAGCSHEVTPDSPDGAEPEPEPEPEPDAGPDPAPDAASGPAACEVPALPGELRFTDDVAVLDRRDDLTQLRVDYNGRHEESLLRLYFMEGQGAFAGGFATGTFPLAGDDLSWQTCGLCALLVSHYWEPARSQYFVPRSGSFVFDRIDETPEGRLVGRADDLDLVRTYWDGSDWIIEDTCAVTLDVSIDLGYEAGPFWDWEPEEPTK